MQFSPENRVRRTESIGTELYDIEDQILSHTDHLDQACVTHNKLAERDSEIEALRYQIVQMDQALRQAHARTIFEAANAARWQNEQSKYRAALNSISVSYRSAMIDGMSPTPLQNYIWFLDLVETPVAKADVEAIVAAYETELSEYRQTDLDRKIAEAFLPGSGLASGECSMTTEADLHPGDLEPEVGYQDFDAANVSDPAEWKWKVLLASSRREDCIDVAGHVDAENDLSQKQRRRFATYLGRNTSVLKVGFRSNDISNEDLLGMLSDDSHEVCTRTGLNDEVVRDGEAANGGRFRCSTILRPTSCFCGHPG